MAIKRIFHRRQYHNPFFPKLKRGGGAGLGRSRKKLKLWPSWKLVLLAGLATLLFFSYADIFKINEIEVSGTKLINSAAVRDSVLQQTKKRRFLLFSQQSIFFFSKRQAKNNLRANFFIEDVKINKDYFNTLKVAIKENQSGLVWITGGTSYYLDLTGKVLEQQLPSINLVVQPTDGNTDVIRTGLQTGGLPVVYDLSNAALVAGQQVVAEDLASFIFQLFKELEASADFTIAHFNVDGPRSQQVVMVSQEGWEARFKTDQDPVAQGQILISVLGQKIGNRNTLQYIDLRYGEKIFYQ